MTTPAAAAPAATPAAVPAAPAPAPAPAPAAAAPVTPPAVAAPAPAPAAPPAAVAAPATPPAAPAPVEASLLGDPVATPPAVPQTQAEIVAAAQKVVDDAANAADPNGRNPDGSKTAWLLTDTVLGEGEKPGWFKSTKYKSVSEQAKAYAELEPRFGSFVGAPKDGKYEFRAPEGIQIKMDAPLMVEFTKWAGEQQLSQDGYTKLMGFLAQDAAMRAPDPAAIKARMGADADTRIKNVRNWATANLDDDSRAAMWDATRGANADVVFKAIEVLISKTAQARMPKPGVDVPGGGGADGLAAIQEAQAKKGPDGKRLYVTDEKYRAAVEKRYRDYYASLG